MEPEEVTKVEVLNLYQQGRTTAEILGEIGSRLNRNVDRIMEDQGLTPLQTIQLLTPSRGRPTADATAGEGEARLPPRMRIDMDALRGRPPAEVAEYMADMMGVNIQALRRQGMTDSDIIVTLGDPESVARAEGFGPAAERFTRSVVRGAPSVLAGAGAAALAAPTGPITAGGAALAAGAAATPVGAALEETVFGPRVPLPPDEFARGRFGDVLGTGAMFLFTPYAFTRGMDPSRLSFLASRTGRDLTPAQAIGVRAVTRPGQALTSETLALTGGAAGSAIAAQSFPDNELAQLAAELAGSLAVPAERLTTVVDRGIGPLIRTLDAARTGDLSRLSRRVVLRDPETGDERLFDLSQGVDRSAAATLRTAGWEQLPTTDPTGISSVMRLRSENAMARLVAGLARDFQESPLETAARLNAAASEPRGLRQLAAEYGIPPDQIPEKLPVAGLVDSPSIRAVYATIESSPGALGPTRARARKQELVRGFEGIEQMVRLLQNTGNPEDFAAAMRLQQELNESALNAMLDANLAPVTAAVSRLSMNDPTARSRAGAAISEAVQGSLTLARRQENQLWQRVDRTMPLDLTNTQSVARSIMADLGISTEQGQIDLSRIASAPLRNFLEVVENIGRRGDVADALDETDPLAALERMLAQEAREFVGEAGEEAVTPTVGNALVLKRNLFDRLLAARSAANPDFGNAQYYGRLYDALMEDLGVSANAVAQSGADGLTENQLALVQANSFSRALNDTFTRAFAGQTLARDARGGQRMIPELMGRALLSGGDDRISYINKELDDAVTFVLDNVALTPEEAALAQGRVDTLRSNQETLLRLIASRVTNPATGEINLNALRTLLRPDNPSGIAQAASRFEGLLEDLQNAETAQFALQRAREGATEAARSQDWLAQNLGGPPGALVNQALGVPGERPSDAGARLRGLVRLANQNGGEFAEFARRGLFDTILSQGITYAGGAKGSINFNALREYFFTPLGRQGGEGNTVAGILREQGLLTDTQLADFNSFIRQGRTIEQALASRKSDTELREALQEVSPLTLAMVGRFLGAAEGARIQRLMGRGGTIQIPGYFANLGARLTDKIPRTSLQDTVVRFLDDAEFAEVTFRRAAELQNMNPNAALRRGQRILRDFEAALIRNGLIAPVAGEAADIQDEGITLPLVGAAEAATPDIAELEAYLQSVQPPAPAPATPAVPFQPTPATPSAGAPPPAAAPAGPPPAPRAGGPSGASYSALFPNDPISPLLQQREIQQGIGSLMAGPR
jgi:hypothetical protein